jgi:hypothetical protein
MQRRIYVDSARQDFKAWLRRKESDWTCSLALVAVKGKGPDEWTLENATITRTDEWRDVEEDCALLRRAVELFSNSELEVVLDNDLTQFVNRHFAPGWMMVIFEHPKKISITVSSSTCETVPGAERTAHTRALFALIQCWRN